MKPPDFLVVLILSSGCVIGGVKLFDPMAEPVDTFCANDCQPADSLYYCLGRNHRECRKAKE